MDAAARGGGRARLTRRDVGKEHPFHRLCPDKPDCKEGDRVRVTRRFDDRAPTFARLRLDATAGKRELVVAGRAGRRDPPVAERDAGRANV